MHLPVPAAVFRTALEGAGSKKIEGKVHLHVACIYLCQREAAEVTERLCFRREVGVVVVVARAPAGDAVEQLAR